MTPKFKNPETWHQAELLMQPIFIRLIDNIRKALDESTWKGTYREETIWDEQVPPDVREQVMQLRQQLATTPPKDAEPIEEALARLPQPLPAYYLCLEQGDRTVSVDLWQVCYQICFKNYHPLLNIAEDIDVEVDTSLIDDIGEVDWPALDAKTKQIVEQIFSSLTLSS
ncbi:hypothetical protein ACQ4M4_19815 [Leptolyngbya sp. AN02str]|uniref:hypothetical protein n=1 Tax=Leptolyngbya sp. AN02str TaxID=3423363 RepID=UPI003D31F991